MRVRGASPRRPPLHAHSRGPHDPRSVRVAHSLRSFASDPSCVSGGLRPAGPPYTLTPGGPTIPAPFVWLTRCARSLLIHHACPGGFAPPAPPTHSLAGTPQSPLRSCGSLAALVRF